jgi:hypothetical protein
VADSRGVLHRPCLDSIRERYGIHPQIKFFETACSTDNAIEAVLLPGAAE